MCNPTLRTIKKAIRERYAWPGGYAIFLILESGECLCTLCARAAFRMLVADNKLGCRNGWTVAGIDNASLYDETPNCCHCGKDIE